MSAGIYRVVVSENRKENKYYVDLANARVGIGFQPTHNVMSAMRRDSDPEAETLTDGLLLYDFGDNNLRLKHEFVTNKKLKAYQDSMIERFQNDIFETYRRMRERGVESTLYNDTRYLATLCSDAFQKSSDLATNKSAVELQNIERVQRAKDLENRRKELLARTKRHSFEDLSYRMKYYYNNRGD